MSLLLGVRRTDEARERTDVRTAFHRISMQAFRCRFDNRRMDLKTEQLSNLSDDLKALLAADRAVA